MPLAIPNLYCTPQDVYDLAGIDAAQLRVDDRNQATGQTVQLSAAALAGATTLTLVSALQYPMLIGEQLVFTGQQANPVTAVLTAVALVGATTLTVSALPADIGVGSAAVDNGVNIAAARLLTTACKWGTMMVKRYCGSLYDDSQMVQDNNVNQWATVVAARWLNLRTYRPNASGIETMYQEMMEELKMVQRGEMQLTDVPPRTSAIPFLSNLTMYDSYTIRKLRVETPISEPTPVQYAQAIDWNSFALLEY